MATANAWDGVDPGSAPPAEVAQPDNAPSPSVVAPPDEVAPLTDDEFALLLRQVLAMDYSEIAHEWEGATLHNLSPVGVRVVGKEGQTIEVPPLGQCAMDSVTPKAFDPRLVGTSPYLVVESAKRTFPEYVLGPAFLAGFLGLVFVPAFTDGWGPTVAWLALCVAVPSVGWWQTRKKKKGARPLRQTLALAIVMLVGFAIPAIVILFGTDLFDALRSDMGHALDPGVNKVILFRCVQAVFIGLAATFPVLLYFVFDRQTMAALRTKFLFALFRLDPSIGSAADWRARYGRQVEGAFGPIGRRQDLGLLHIRNSPVVMATLVLAVGWSLAFLNGDKVTVATIESDTVPLDLLVPARSLVAYGFLGAYFFTVQTVLRSYMRGDLRPKSYSAVTARILVVVALCAVLNVSELRDNPALLAIVFFAGVMPEAILQWVWETVQQGATNKSQKWRGESFVDRRPLTDLDGIDIYERARLAEEGVTNVEALAHGDLVDLLLQTRIPAEQLVDWVDQAALHIQIDNRDLMTRFRRNGVRTATDLLVTYNTQKHTLAAALGLKDGNGPARLEVIVTALQDAEWVRELTNWRESKQSADGTHLLSTEVVVVPGWPELAEAVKQAAPEEGGTGPTAETADTAPEAMPPPVTATTGQADVDLTLGAKLPVSSDADG